MGDTTETEGQVAPENTMTGPELEVLGEAPSRPPSEALVEVRGRLLKPRVGIDIPALPVPEVFGEASSRSPAAGLMEVRGRPSEPRVTIVIPALNEGKNLRAVLPRLPDWIFEVILVDGGSTDDTVATARELWPNVRVMGHPGRGKGNALRYGFAAATGDVIVMLDADGSADPDEIPTFVSVLKAGADFAKGSRFRAGGGSADITLLRRCGNWALIQLVNFLYGTNYTDLCYGMNAFWRDCLASIPFTCDGFEVETMISIRLARASLRVTEVPSFEYRRVYGASNLHTFRDGWRVLRVIVGEFHHGAKDAQPKATEKEPSQLDPEFATNHMGWL